jgi:hypothetical protein
LLLTVHIAGAVGLVGVGIVLVALGTGALQVALTGYGPLKHGWVTAKLGITSLLMVAAVAVVLPGLGRPAAAATAPEGHLTDPQRLVATVTPAIASTLLLLNVALGVFKPGRAKGGAVPTRNSRAQTPTSLPQEPR